MRRVAFDHDASLAAALELLGGPDPPTAVACGNDMIAIGVLSAAATLGLSVPGQLTVIGFDDIRAAGWPLIGLTTVHCDLEALARTGVELLRAEMSNPGTAAAVSRIPVRLVRRRTHAEPGPDG